jgi:predicted short-subunit dehydrogenase-like oxidoreductase (DUF2520 family)
LAHLSPGQKSILNRCSLLLITTPDDVIESSAAELSDLILNKSAATDSSLALAGRVALHTSGALSSEVLKALRRAGFALGSLHPLLSISDSQSGATALRTAFFSIEGELAAVRLAKRIVRDLGGESFTIEAHLKALYHAAAVIASPHVTALFDIASEMLGACGLGEDRARRVLLPLLESTVNNLRKQNATSALTGTFKRADVATVRKHLSAIKDAQLPSALAAYVALGQRSVSIAQRRKSHHSELQEIQGILTRAAKRPS